jgi:prolyl-tRNA editing enzyme YbaK/EbsC (Cys-tRNA(Pro) deacylase)
VGAVVSLLERDSVRRVRAALAAAGSDAQPIELAETARSAEDAARAIGCELGQIVKSLVFAIDGRPVLALVAGDRRCRLQALPAALGLAGSVGRADAEVVRRVTGFAIGGVPPLGHLEPLPTAIDASLWRYGTVYAAAGHPHCVFPASPDELAAMTGGAVDAAIAEPAPA